MKIFDEHFDTQLAYEVKQLIEAVSQETEVNFFEDTNLYKMLLTHLSGVFLGRFYKKKI